MIGSRKNTFCLKTFSPSIWLGALEINFEVGKDWSLMPIDPQDKHKQAGANLIKIPSRVVVKLYLLVPLMFR